MTLQFTRADGEEVVIFHRMHPGRPPLRIKIGIREESGVDPIVVEVPSNSDFIVVRSELADREDFDLNHFLEK